MTDLVENLALRDVEARLVFFVAEEMKGRGLALRDGAVYEIPVSKNVLASRLGTVPETFSRTLKKLQEEGKIRVKGNQIRILKAQSLFGALAPCFTNKRVWMSPVSWSMENISRSVWICIPNWR